VWVLVAAAPLISLGVTSTFVVALFLLTRVPPIGTTVLEGIAYFIFLSTAITIAAAAPWWFPIAYLYRRRAFLLGALLATPPALLRALLLANRPMSAASTATAIIETAGLVLVVAVGSHIVVQRLSANNSFKPRSLRGRGVVR